MIIIIVSYLKSYIYLMYVKPYNFEEDINIR